MSYFEKEVRALHNHGYNHSVIAEIMRCEIVVVEEILSRCPDE